MKKNTPILLLLIFILAQFGYSQNMAVNTTGATPDPKAILDISSTNTGLLIPRMTTVQRDAITSVPNGLQVFNTTTSTLDVYRNGNWQALSYTNASSNIVNIYSLSDLPTPSGSSITLDANKMYVFSGIINISPYYLNLNGANLRGIDPSKDGVMSTISGGILRSTGVGVFIQDLAVIPASGSTKAYDFADATGTKFCNIFSGSSVVEIGIPSLGVGQISGFKAITIQSNYWNCKDGIKVTGTTGKFCSSFNFITGISSGAGIEFLSGLIIDDIDLSNNYFVFTGQTGIKLNAGATVDKGRMNTNMFRGVGTNISGFNSYTPGWQLVSNTGAPSSRSLCFSYMTNNTTATSLPVLSTYYKIAGTTTATKQQKFTAGNNRHTFNGKEGITGKISVIMAAKSPVNSGDFSIAIAKNGTIIQFPNGSTPTLSNNQGFQISLITEVDMVTNDYIEVFIRKNNTNSSSLIVEELQFMVSD